MFLQKDDVKEKVREIILDEHDNDIVFVVAAKGIGKLRLLEELFNIESSNREIIVANGSRIHNAASCLSKCYIDGICSYIEKHNYRDVKKKFLNLLPKGRLSALEKISFLVDVFIVRRKIKVSDLITCLSDLSLKQLKEIYVGLAGETPLILLAGAISLNSVDMEYLLDLNNDDWGARVTYIIALRPTSDSLNIIGKTIDIKKRGVWVFPLLPQVVSPPKATLPKSIASIYINDVGSSDAYNSFQQALIANSDYFEMYDLVHGLLRNGLHPTCLCFLANQEIQNSTYIYLKDIISKIYPDLDAEYDKRLVLPYDGRLLWLDALSYYIALQEGIDDAIKSTQSFFFDIIKNLHYFSQGSPTRKSFIAFLNDAKQNDCNQLADGFAMYYSSFASFAKAFSSKNEFYKNSYENSMLAIEILDRAVLEFSDKNIDSHIKILDEIYGYSQYCSILDIGIETLTRFFEKGIPLGKIKKNTVEGIANFQSVCMSAAFRWLDVTLLEKLALLQKSIQGSGRKIKFKCVDFAESKEKSYMFNYFVKRVSFLHLKLEDIIMRETIFLSYTHTNAKIADMIETALVDMGYDVKRDTRNVEQWDDLQEFMKKIRKQDYAVFLVSDTYLHRVNCMYEIMQFMKDEDALSRAFPIAINLTKEELESRKCENLSTSMFDDFYCIEIVAYWQDYADKMRKTLDKLKRENSGELDQKFRIVNELAQTAAKFIDGSFGKKLLATVNPDNPKVDDIAKRIDELIQKNNSDR